MDPELQATLIRFLDFMVTNFPNFLGLVVTIIIMEVRYRGLKADKDFEIERLQGHNDRLMMWCRHEDAPPLE